MTTLNKAIIGLVGLSLLASVAYLFQAGESPEAYRERIEKERLETREFMTGSDESPFRGSNAPEFHGLNYFPIDQRYVVAAWLEPFAVQDDITLPSSTGTPLRYKRHGMASFELQGQKHELLVLEPVDNPGTLFVGFRDETSGESTYGGGRYLDLPIPSGSTLVIDFNMAYNPYCAYVADFACPIPPAENTLPIAIEAGEMNYK